MSLLLRTACQPVLDNAGLQNFHCATSTSGNYLTIVGECGQLFVSITGVQFARSVPSHAELPLAVELLEAFLMKHKPDFDIYITELAKYEKLPVIEKKVGVFEIESSGYGSNEHWVCDIKDDIFDIRILEDAEIKTCKLDSSLDDVSIADLCKHKFNPTLLRDAVLHIKHYRAYLDAGATIRELKEKLSSCEI